MWNSGAVLCRLCGDCWKRRATNCDASPVIASEREAIYRVSCQRRIEHFLRMYHGVERYDELSEHSDEGYFVRLSAGS